MPPPHYDFLIKVRREQSCVSMYANLKYSCYSSATLVRIYFPGTKYNKL